MTKKEKREAEQWARQEYHKLRGKGKSHKEAMAAVNAAGVKKFGAIDWDGLLGFITKLLELFSKFFP